MLGRIFLVTMKSCELAEAASLVVDAELEIVTGAQLDELVDVVFRERFLMALGGTLRGLFAQKRLVLRRRELTPGGETFRFGHREQLRLVALPLDLADHGRRPAMTSDHAADGQEA